MTPKPKPPREMTQAEIDAAFEQIQKNLDEIVEREKEKAQNG